jgi:hypothetical protein
MGMEFAITLADEVRGGIKLLSRILGAYYGYTQGKRKEDDIAVRKKIMNEIQKSRNNLTNLLEEAAEGSKRDMANTAKKVIDELDILNTEVDLSEMGHQYPFFSIQKSCSSSQIEKLVEFDQSLVVGMENVSKATETLYHLLIEKQVQDPMKELKKIKQYIITCRNYYKDRRDYLKGLK